jgi:hypothetical protein
MYIPRQNAPIRRTPVAMAPDDHSGCAEPAACRMHGTAPGVVPSSFVDAIMYAIRGPSKEGCEGPILVVPGS